jgi:hypothetical protein
MILVRDILQVKFGRMKDALALMKELGSMTYIPGHRVGRILTDLTGKYYTLVLESTFESLAAYENQDTAGMATPEWRAWYAKFSPLIESGNREIFRIVE